MNEMTGPAGPELHFPTYDWSVRLFTLLRKAARVNLKMHQDDAQIEDGDIFLFNHFARFETFIPQYFIHKETGAYCRSVASAEFFDGDDAFSNYLLRLGAVPNNTPRLLVFLAAEVLRGRKIIVFPEGGMVKDRKALDERGEYAVYSRSSNSRRKHHTGAAVLAIALQTYKRAVLHAQSKGDTALIDAWAQALELEDGRALLNQARRPTRIVPANITFYPIRVNDNLLRRGAEILSGGLSRRLSEELLIEGNILLRDTDMDIRLGEPIDIGSRLNFWERSLMNQVSRRVRSLDEAFALRPRGGKTLAGRLGRRAVFRVVRRQAQRIRDDYMRRMYDGVTVNLSHLASTLILELVERQIAQMPAPRFHRLLYLAVKLAQTGPGIKLHRSLRNPEFYGRLPEGECRGLDQFVESATSMMLLSHAEGRYVFEDKLMSEHTFDEIRVENLIEVYANEMAPIGGAMAAVRSAIERMDETSAHNEENEVVSITEAQRHARLLFDDELLAQAWDRRLYSKPEHAEINAAQRATRDPSPFLEVPEAGRSLGVVLVHGFLATPAEMRGFGDELKRLGFPVMGVRLKGHGTSPWDMRERRWSEWLASVQRGIDILSAFVERVCVVGFSTGGTLSLMAAANNPQRVCGVATVNAAIRFRDRNIKFVPLVVGANRLVRMVSPAEGLMVFRPNEPENPEVNYNHMPVRSLNELRSLIDVARKQIGNIKAPALVVQADADPVVAPESAELIAAALGSATVERVTIKANRHGILYSDVGETRAQITRFIEALDGGRE